MKKLNVRTLTLGNISLIVSDSQDGSIPTVDMKNEKGDLFRLEETEAKGLIDTFNVPVDRPAMKRAPVAKPRPDGSGKAKAEKPASAAAGDHSKQARRYSEDERAKLVAGFNAAENKAEFARMNDVGIDSLRRWMKQSAK